MKRYLLLAYLVTLNGCTQLGVTEQKLALVDVLPPEGENTIQIATLPTQLRSVYVYTKANGVRYTCAEPSPDVAAANSLSATASAVNQLSTTLNTALNEAINRAYSDSNNHQQNSSSQTSEGSSVSTTGSAAANSGSYGNSSGATYGAAANAQQSINLALNAATQIVSLEGRTQFVLLARELSFRTCEAAANGEYDKEDSKVYAQHKNIIDALIKMIDTQKTEAETKKINAIAEAAKKLDPNILANVDTDSTVSDFLRYYLSEREKCISAAARDRKKIQQCESDYSKKVSKLYGK